MKRKRTRPSLEARQDAVLHDYKMSLSPKGSDVWNLHLFFSPERIPVGLTDEEVQVCINLYPLREAQEQRRMNNAMGEISILDDPLTSLSCMAHAIAGRRSLPPEFEVTKVMTRIRFRKAVYAFLIQSHL